MYSQLNKYAKQIMKHLETKQQFTEVYPKLCLDLDRIDVSDNSNYQKAYRKFWSMNQARLNDGFYVKYFEILQENKNNREGILQRLPIILEDLYNIPQGKKMTNKYHFSFVSKLCHMVNNDLPIYDKYIKSFYFLPDVDKSKPIDSFLKQFNFLISEYSRISRNNLLSDIMIVFNQSKLSSKNYSTTKIIDVTIWTFVDLLFKNKIERSDIYK